MNGNHLKTCHNCGNVRRELNFCTACPQVFCHTCYHKIKFHEGPNIFTGGCVVCKHACCCVNKTKECNRTTHCYKKCPLSRVKTGAVLKAGKGFPDSSGFVVPPKPKSLKVENKTLANVQVETTEIIATVDTSSLVVPKPRSSQTTTDYDRSYSTLASRDRRKRDDMSDEQMHMQMQMQMPPILERVVGVDGVEQPSVPVAVWQWLAGPGTSSRGGNGYNSKTKATHAALKTKTKPVAVAAAPVATVATVAAAGDSADSKRDDESV